jgi:hypothetical protein
MWVFCEVLGSTNPTEYATQATNCTSTDTGNMEVLARYGYEAQKQHWLVPLFDVCYDQTCGRFVIRHEHLNLHRPRREGRRVRDQWALVVDHRGRVILMGKTRQDGPLRSQQSQLLVPMNTPDITLVRPMLALGDDDGAQGSHGDLVRERTDTVRQRLTGRRAGLRDLTGPFWAQDMFITACGPSGRPSAVWRSCVCACISAKGLARSFQKFDTILQDIAKSRADIDSCRLLVQDAAAKVDAFSPTVPCIPYILSHDSICVSYPVRFTV